MSETTTPGDHSGRFCTEPDCDRPFKAMGLCKRHYNAARRKARAAARPARPDTKVTVVRPSSRRKVRPVETVAASHSYPDRHISGQRIAVYDCPNCHGQHLVAWSPFDEHPGRKRATCIKGSMGSGYNPEYIVLAPPVEQQLDREPKALRLV